MVNATTPLRIGYVLFPALTALDLFGPLQALNFLSIKQNITLSLISTDLEPVSIDRTILDGVSQGMLGSSASPYFSQFVLPTHTFTDAALNDLDVILVPGGPGTRNLNATQPAVDWLRARMDSNSSSPSGGPDYMLTVCTGASLLARTGYLEGRNATTNKAAFDWVRSVEHADKVNWVPKARWVVDGNVWTSSGVSAGTDMMLSWTEHVYGRNASETARITMEWNALNQTDDPFAGLYGLA
ncbi:hypothetical protein SLS62_008041 [Diatrype stigma]|uniref:DJ-1/PfpI domain-containing protein n=1 Tax=Diatrype stigma TaxID=117547 RepID=A0AAN9YLV1_9PEZI